MRIVHVVRQFYPAIGGFESVVWELATRQAGEGHTVRVITLDRLFKTDKPAKLAARETIAGIEIIRIPFVGSSRYPIAPAGMRSISSSTFWPGPSCCTTRSLSSPPTADFSIRLSPHGSSKSTLPRSHEYRWSGTTVSPR
jgi:hypothetical protein